LKVLGTEAFDAKISPGVWKEKVNYLGEKLFRVFSNRLVSAETILNTDFSQHSIVETIVTSPNGAFVCEIRLRPQDKYYKKYSTLPVPVPRNPKGHHACGISVELKLLQGLKQNKIFYPPKIMMSFHVWGENERNAFKRMFFDYRKLTELIINEEDFQFFVAVPLPRLEKYKGKNIGRKLELYFQRDDDQEHSFDINKLFTAGVNQASVYRSLTILSALYFYS